MVTVLDSLNQGLRHALAMNTKVILLGQDLLDPYGGAFKVTRGLSTQFPKQIITTPISEAGIVGIAAGMALRGMRPVVEIMFGDFLTLAADQIINHVTKYRWMYNNQVEVPLVIRTPMGGRRGYGPTHSQTLEKHFLGIPGLQVLAANTFGEPGELLAQTILNEQGPTLFIENKLLYPQKLLSQQHTSDIQIQAHNNPPWHIITINGAPKSDVTLLTYGYMAELAVKAMITLAYEEEIFAELIVPTRLAPYEISPILESTRKTHRLLIIEEGGLTLGWGAEILALHTTLMDQPLKTARRIAAMDLPIPASGRLEDAVLPQHDQILSAAREITSR